MSKWAMKKLKIFSVSLTLAFVVFVNFDTDNASKQANLLASCMAIESNLPMSHSNHPCHATYTPKKSWVSWLTNDNKSAHLHFLDLVELLHYSFH